MAKSESNQSRNHPHLAPVVAGNEHMFAPEPAEEGGLPIIDYWRVIKRYRWSILGIAMIAAVIGTLNALSATSLYQARARLLVKFNQPNISNLQQFESTPLHWLYFETQSDIIRSRAVAERVVERLKKAKFLTHEPSDVENAAKTSPTEIVRGWMTELKSWLPEEMRSPQRQPLDSEARRVVLVNSVLGGVSVTGGKESEVLVIRYVSANPRYAAAAANAFAEAYISFGLESRLSNVQQTTSWLGERI